MKIQVIVGSTRPGRTSEKVAKWVMEQVEQTEGVEFELLDLKDYPLPFYEENGSPKSLKGKYENPLAQKWNDKVGEGDGYIIITAEYNHGYTPVLKNALDYVYFNWNNKPVGYVSYGTVGGARAVEQLRQVAVELQQAPIRESVLIPKIWEMQDQAGNLQGMDEYNESFKLMLDQLLWWTKALKTARDEN